jgi:type II secretory ATPase GspE/PulE/Tfp pilus assembly ATPase PilB-like protein
MQERASDIHFHVSQNPRYCWIAHRIDGVLHFVYMVNPIAMSAVATRIKSDAGMDFSDTLRPHDGRTEIHYNERKVDIRVSSLPVDFGEKLVLRMLDSSNTPPLSLLFAAHPLVRQQIEYVVSSTQKSGGVMLITGATGSGKSTTLNAMLASIDRTRRAVVTVEDPVELRVPLVGHTQVNEAAGLTYSKVLRTLLRQDPDVIMVGELRDEDTVETALRAAETGHLVLSTLHTDSVAESVTRLMGMMETSFRSIGKYIISGSLKGVVNQKLVRRLCTKCTKQGSPDVETLEALKRALGEDGMPATFNVAVGCPRCNDTGYYGRVPIPEALFIGTGHETRAALETILVKELSFRAALSLPGVLFYPRHQAIAAVLASNIVDAETALSVLDIQQGAGLYASSRAEDATEAGDEA